MKTKVNHLAHNVPGVRVMGVIAVAFFFHLVLWSNNHIESQHVPDAGEWSNHSNESQVVEAFPAEKQYCLSCHQGIMSARSVNSKMMRQIFKRGAEQGDPNGCVICHGGSPQETTDKDKAHNGVPKGGHLKAFTAVPGALQVNENTCGLCHQDHTYNVQRSIMNTDAGKMKALTWSWGIATEDKNHLWGDHDIHDPDGTVPRFGTERYKAYMKEMADAFPGQYPSELKQIPDVDLGKLSEMPEQAVFTYLRNCNACHLSNKGKQDRGHFRGMGCAACHSLYSNEGFYEGADPSIDQTQSGHVMVHRMQATRKTKVEVNGKHFSGIQVSTCTACHSAGRRIGHAYQGLMALGHGDHRGPFNEEGESQKANAGYVFKYIRNDAHHRIDKNGKTVTGLLCQDCHTSNSMHGNGNIGSTCLATVEVECADCHGTPERYPWELPIGYGDEFNKKLNRDNARGVSDKPMNVTAEFATNYEKQDGYVLSARGNPLGNVVKSGNRVIVHSANGHDFEVPVLKNLKEEGSWNNPLKAETAMVKIAEHMQKLECYACHSTWVPQYYGFKYVIDYTKQSIDWLDSPEIYGADGTTADYKGEYVMQPGANTNWDYSHVRWEQPPLGINGEGRVSPLTGVIQTVGTVLDPQGKTIVWNYVAKTDQGYNAIELAPLNPHTTSRASRECTDCHGNSITMGYGVDNGDYDSSPEVTRYADIVDTEGHNVSEFTQAQIHAIAELHGDFTQLLDKDGQQLQTVDSHWPGSQPLTKLQRDVLSRSGVCLSCHRDISDEDIPVNMLRQVAAMTNMSFKTMDEHDAIVNQNNMLISWIKAIGIVSAVVFVLLLCVAATQRKRIKRLFGQFKAGYNSAAQKETMDTN
ncbi:MAG: hypothetical protein CR997_01680 [Acidobacteria bacterium]|nr:MAG: hypothetical protein CR997_01680 [Acidobacteriota bacterium]